MCIRDRIYTKGSWGLNAQSAYVKRYKFSGNFFLSYLVTVLGDKGMPDYSKQTNFKLTWSCLLYTSNLTCSKIHRQRYFQLFGASSFTDLHICKNKNRGGPCYTRQLDLLFYHRSRTFETRNSFYRLRPGKSLLPTVRLSSYNIQRK